MKTEDIEKLALAYTEKEYYKVDDKDELNGEPLAVFRAYCQALSVFQSLQDNADKLNEAVSLLYKLVENTELFFGYDEANKNSNVRNAKTFINSLNKQDNEK